jgi:hypothetical protein
VHVHATNRSQRFTGNLADIKDPVVLMGSLGRINGQKQQQEIVDWFYQAQARVTQQKSDESNHGPADFLRSVLRARRTDTQELMVALVADPRFDQADWPSIKWLLAIASDGLPEPLVSLDLVDDRRIKCAACAGTAQTRALRRGTFSDRFAFDWRLPLRLFAGLSRPDLRCYDNINSWFTCPSTSGRVKSRPPKRYVSASWSSPS